MAEEDEAFTEKDVVRLLRQILSGVAFLHRHGVVHLDLKVPARGWGLRAGAGVEAGPR